LTSDIPFPLAHQPFFLFLPHLPPNEFHFFPGVFGSISPLNISAGVIYKVRPETTLSYFPAGDAIVSVSPFHPSFLWKMHLLPLAGPGFGTPLCYCNPISPPLPNCHYLLAGRVWCISVFFFFRAVSLSSPRDFPAGIQHPPLSQVCYSYFFFHAACF